MKKVLMMLSLGALIVGLPGCCCKKTAAPQKVEAKKTNGKKAVSKKKDVKKTGKKDKYAHINLKPGAEIFS